MANVTRAHMSLEEFRALPESLDHIELIDGELIVSPTPTYPHQSIVGNVLVELKRLPQGTAVVSPMDVYLDDANVVQSDVFWVSGESSLCQLGDDGYWHGAPDLAVEVLSPSTALHDRGVKYRLYEQHGTREYWLIDPEGEFVEVFRRAGDRFDRLGAFGRDDSFTLAVLPDVVLQVAAWLT